MALTLGKQNVNTYQFAAGDRSFVVVDFVCDNSYPTGGYALTGANLGLDTELDFVTAHVQAGPTATASSFSYDYANSKLKALTAAAEIANTTDLHTVKGRLLAVGKAANPLGNAIGS